MDIFVAENSEEQYFLMMRGRNRGWKIFWFLISILQLAAGEDLDTQLNFTRNNENPSQRSLFSPRMDYEQWKPLGHGDPLKNDPTYDYVPPVLDRVHYWADTSLRQPDTPLNGDNKKTEILLLGVSSKKAATGNTVLDSRRDPFDPFVKYVENNHFNQNQRGSRPQFIPPAPPVFPFNQKQNKFSERTSFLKGPEQRVPYTMLMPPPININRDRPQIPENIATQRPLQQIFPASTFLLTTVNPVTPAVTIEESNLIYHSSSLSDASEFQNNNRNQFETLAPSINWELQSTTLRPHVDFNEQFVYNKNLAPPESYIHIEFAPQNLSNKQLDGADSNHNVNYVTPPPLINMMHKGHVSDDDDISNSYVKIGKPEAAVQPTGIDIINVRPPSPLKMFPHRYSKPFAPPKIPPLTMQTIEQMQTMQPPPPVTHSPSFAQSSTNVVFNLLAAERTRPPAITTTEVFDTTQVLDTTSVFANTRTETKPTTTSTSSSSTSTSTTSTSSSTTSTTSTTTTTTARTTPKRTTTKRTTTSTTEQPLTTTMTSLTTDPLFKHYKQPVEPLKGPLYLIIQGHSKVKKYGPKKEMHGIPIQETNEISDNVDYVVTHLHGFRDKDPIARKSRNRDLQTLKHVIETGLGSIDFEDVSEETNRRSDDDVQETNIQAGYEVADAKDVTSERYHKGIVEAVRKLRQRL